MSPGRLSRQLFVLRSSRSRNRPPAAGWRRLPVRVWCYLLCWSGVSFNLGERLAFTLHGIAAAARVPWSRRRNRCRSTCRHLSAATTLSLGQARKHPLTTKFWVGHCQGWEEPPS
jgi:hypothetical protein